MLSNADDNTASACSQWSMMCGHNFTVIYFTFAVEQSRFGHTKSCATNELISIQATDLWMTIMRHSKSRRQWNWNYFGFFFGNENCNVSVNIDVNNRHLIQRSPSLGHAIWPRWWWEQFAHLFCFKWKTMENPMSHDSRSIALFSPFLSCSFFSRTLSKRQIHSIANNMLMKQQNLTTTSRRVPEWCTTDTNRRTITFVLKSVINSAEMQRDGSVSGKRQVWIAVDVVGIRS